MMHKNRISKLIKKSQKSNKSTTCLFKKYMFSGRRKGNTHRGEKFEIHNCKPHQLVGQLMASDRYVLLDPDANVLCTGLSLRCPQQHLQCRKLMDCVLVLQNWGVHIHLPQLFRVRNGAVPHPVMLCNETVSVGGINFSGGPWPGRRGFAAGWSRLNSSPKKTLQAIMPMGLS